MRTISKTYTEFMQDIYSQYYSETDDWRATADEISEWAIRKSLWEPKKQDAVKLCARDIASAMRQEYFKDEHGRSVRAKHAAREKSATTQGVFWADIRRAPREHIELAFQQRRRQIVGTCRQLKVDVDFYNEHHSEQEPIQMVFSFVEDLQEIEAVEAVEAIEKNTSASPDPRKPR